MTQNNDKHDDDLRKASSIRPEPIEWLWRERLPKGKISVVAGKPDQGKGLFAAHVAAAVSKRGSKVLYSAMEDDHGTMTRPRLEAAGANLDNVLIWRFHLPTQMDELAAHIIDNDIRLVVMDPFAAHLQGVSRYSDSIRRVLTPLTKLAEQTNCSILVIEHALKRVANNAHPLSAIGGNSSGVVAAARAAFVFGKDPNDDDRRVLACVKLNVREMPKAVAFEIDTDEFSVVGEIPSLLMQGECEFDPKRLLTTDADGKPGRKPDKRAAAAEWLTQYLIAANKPVLAKVIKEDAKHAHGGGISNNTLRRAVEDMGIVKSAAGGPHVTWDLPSDLKTALGMEAS